MTNHRAYPLGWEFPPPLFLLFPILFGSDEAFRIASPTLPGVGFLYASALSVGAGMDVIRIFWGVFPIPGVLFFFGKAPSIWPPWKNMPQEEKEKIKLLPLCCNMGAIGILSDVIFLRKGLWADFPNHWFVGARIAWLMMFRLDVWHRTKPARYKQV